MKPKEMKPNAGKLRDLVAMVAVRDNLCLMYFNSKKQR